ncbi:MAG: FMN-dependent NADH-azoreductase 1 [Chlamydiae bacterium]|nr:FMN-dependent NADH-azoreductase 1 [Chlamydiota bacterium]
MARLLYIESSPRKQRSASISVSRTFLENYSKKHPEDTIETIDLWKEELPIFDGPTIDAKYAIMHGQPHTEPQKKAWQAVEKVIAKFKTTDKYLISLPMWNFGIPYKLKHYLDVLVQPTYTFASTPEGTKGLITGKPLLLILSRGGTYQGESAAFDYQKPYLEMILKFIGFTDIHSVIIEPTLSGKEAKEKALERATAQALELAKTF